MLKNVNVNTNSMAVEIKMEKQIKSKRLLDCSLKSLLFPSGPLNSWILIRWLNKNLKSSYHKQTLHKPQLKSNLKIFTHAVNEKKNR